MKKLLVSVLAIAGLVACNNEQTLVKHNDKVAMEFGAFVENALTTRAAQDPSLKTADLTGFDVWAYMDSYDGLVLSDEDVELVNGAWSYANLQYWLPGHDYYFTAIAPMNGENWDYAQTAETISFTNVEGTEDLLFATATSSTKDESVTAYETVKLTFKHLLSKTKFTFKNGYTTKNMDIVVSNIQMVAPESANYEINSTEAHKWTNYADEVTLAYGDVERIGAGAKAESTYERLTIPATAAQDYKITYDITVYSGEVVAFEVSKETILSDVALEQGKAYNFVATITPDNIIDGGLQPIVFEVVEVVDWVYVTEDEGQIAEAELRAAVQLGGNVELTNNVVLTAPLNVTKDLVLNLNGFTLTNAVENAATDVIVVAEGATLTVEGEGVIEAVSGNDGYAIISEGTVVINGGEIKAGVDANGAANAVVYARGNGQVYVNGGYFPNDNASKYVLNKKDADRATTVIEVRGGKFFNFDPANNAAENPAENFCAEGYGVAVDGEWYTVVKTTVSTAADFKAIFGVANEVKLAADIDLSGSEWTPVGTSTDLCKTNLDGQGHKIIGLNVSGDYAGLIAYAAEGVTVKNVIFEDVKVESEKFGAAVICVANENVTVENVTVSGTVNCGSYAAGIVCFNSYDEDPSITIKDCVNNATVNGNRAGGIGAWVTGNSVIENVVNNGDVTGATSAAGITNRIAGTITNAKNYGNIVGNGTEASAGIAGTQTAASTFEYCFNYGNVTTTKDNANSSAAGILGQTPSKAATLNYCANFGAITAEKSYAAGIAYSLYGNVKASYCYNEGAVNGEDGAGAIAPKAQYGANDTANYCLNAGAISSSKGKVYQGSNKNTSCYYYGDGVLKNVADNAVVAEADALLVLNGGADADFFGTDAGKIVVK